MHLDIFKLKTVREHLTVDLEPANLEFEEMTSILVHLPLLHFYRGPLVEFRQSVVEVLALQTLRSLLLELQVCSTRGELQGQDVLHGEARPVAGPAVLGRLELEPHPPLCGQSPHRGEQDGLLTSKLDLIFLTELLRPSSLNICT